MMGGYLVYLNGKLTGDICSNELFLKRTPTSDRLLADSELRYPYAGSKTLMHVFDRFEDTALVPELLDGMVTELPEKRKNMESTMNDTVYRFDAVIQKNPDMDAAYVIFPYDIRKKFGKGRVKVHATFDGAPYDGSIVNMGVKDADGKVCYVIGMPKAIRKVIGKTFGDTVAVTIRERE